MSASKLEPGVYLGNLTATNEFSAMYENSIRRSSQIEVKEERPAIGTVVRALLRIDDVDCKGNPYIHAQPGDTGVIIGYYHEGADYEDKYPTINWSLGSGHGIYDCLIGDDITLNSCVPPMNIEDIEHSQ